MLPVLNEDNGHDFMNKYYCVGHTWTERNNEGKFTPTQIDKNILVDWYEVQSAYNLSDMLSKDWDHPTVYPMILKLLITRGNITLIPKEAYQEKEKENLKLQPEKLKNKENEE